MGCSPPENVYYDKLAPIERQTAKETVAVIEEDERIQYSSESDVEDSLSSDDETEYETTNLAKVITFAVGTVDTHRHKI